jgi:hypothetical protein
MIRRLFLGVTAVLGAAVAACTSGGPGSPFDTGSDGEGDAPGNGDAKTDTKVDTGPYGPYGYNDFDNDRGRPIYDDDDRYRATQRSRG